MNQGTFAFYDDQMQQAGIGSTVSGFSASCTGTASVTGQQTTTTATGGLWRWGDGVVTDPSNPEGEWAELAEWIHFDQASERFYYRRDKKEIFEYSANRTKLNTAGIVPGGFLGTSIHKKKGTISTYVPIEISRRLFVPIQSYFGKDHSTVFQTHKLLFRLYRQYDSKKLTHIDHMDGDSSCNSVFNLRPVTALQNRINSSKAKWSVPGVNFNFSRRRWESSLYSKYKRFLEEPDAITFRRALLKEEIDKGNLEKHDLWAFDKRVLSAFAYRKENNVDAFNRKIQAFTSPVAPISPSDSVTYFLPPVEPIQPRFNTLWYRPAMSVV